MTRSHDSGEAAAAQISDVTSPDLHRKVLLLIAIFSIVHFLMLTARVAVVEMQDQLQIARARAFLLPAGALVCYAMFGIMRRLRGMRFLKQALFGAALSIVAAVVHATIWANFLHNLDAGKVPSRTSYVLYQSFYWYLFYFAFITAYLALSYSITVREQERWASALLAEAQEAKIRALRYQINPHFLFNTLNSIAALIGEDQAQAEAMVLNLSEFFRASLAVEPTDEVRLSDEAALQALYLEIERVRFPERVSVSIQIPAELRGALVPNLILQPLVENAVRHGVARSASKTTITIHAAAVDGRLILSVADDAVRAPASSRARNGTGVGLNNVRNRLRARYGEDCLLTTVAAVPSGFRAEISVPLRF
ncbi:MAG TPA: histidine kinase [Allosphingosinicella sp.]